MLTPTPPVAAVPPVAAAAAYVPVVAVAAAATVVVVAAAVVAAATAAAAAAAAVVPLPAVAEAEPPPPTACVCPPTRCAWTRLLVEVRGHAGVAVEVQGVIVADRHAACRGAMVGKGDHRECGGGCRLVRKEAPRAGGGPRY